MEEPPEESQSEVDIKVDVSSSLSPSKHLQKNHKLKNLVIKLERIDSRVSNASNLSGHHSGTSGKCVVCSEPFFVPKYEASTKSKNKKGPRSRTKVDEPQQPRLSLKDFHFLLANCLEASDEECRRMRSKGDLSNSFCPKHAASLVEAQRVREELETLEKLLKNLRKQIRDAVVESFVLEENSWSSASSKNNRQYTNLRAILRDVSSKYVEEREVDSPQKNLRRSPAKTSFQDSPFIFTGENKSQTEVKEEPKSPPHVDDFENFDDICDLPILDLHHQTEQPYSSDSQDTSAFPTLTAEKPIPPLGNTENSEIPVADPLAAIEAPDPSEFEFGGPISPTNDPDYCPTDEEEPESPENLEDGGDDEDYKPEQKSSSPSKRSPKRKIKCEPTEGDPLKPKKKRKYDSTRRQKDSNGIPKPKRRRRAVAPPENPQILTYCKFCDTNFDSPETLKSHQATQHGDTKKYTCKTCPNRYKTRQMLEDHQRRDHVGILTIPCDLCDRLYATASLMKDHRRKHLFDTTPLPCPLGCSPKIYKGKHRVALHMKYAHSETPPKRYPQPDLICADCGKSYRNFDALDLHRQKVHLKTNPKVVCDICGKELSDNRSLKKHKNSQHFQNFKFLCELCPTRCLFKSHLDAHVKSAHGGGILKSGDAQATKSKISKKSCKKKKKRRRKESYVESGTEEESPPESTEEDFEEDAMIPLAPSAVIDKVEASISS